MFSVLFSLFNFSFKVSDSSSCTFSSRIVRSFWSSSSCICSVSRVYYEYYHLDGTEEIPADYKEISFVCLRPDGCLELPSTLSIVCRSVAKRLDGFENFHFHQLRHTYTSNLLSNGAAPKDVQELLGHSDVSTIMNVYAHSTRKAKRNSARLLDKVAGND
ncbi:tyrosine-type recombinase/integrase [Bacteroides galacturonicus]|nr:Tyrosine recombinase XerC [Lachnospira pectinoschiza]